MGELVISVFNKLKRYILRNKMLLCGAKKEIKRVNLDYWTKKENVGDTLGPIVFDWMLKNRGLTRTSISKKTSILLTVGSIVGINHYNAVIWGSGIHTVTSIVRVYKWRKKVKFDIRAVRGPLTKQILEFSHYNCSNAVYGDPAILMPLIYQPHLNKKIYKASVITHWYYDNNDDDEIKSSGLNTIPVETNDYKRFIDEIVSSELIISSSLHGIIIAESYGVPAVFLNRNNCMEKELLKFYDWYYSTGRYSVIIATSLSEALKIEPMKIPDLNMLREKLISNFPYDLWIN